MSLLMRRGAGLSGVEVEARLAFLSGRVLSPLPVCLLQPLYVIYAWFVRFVPRCLNVGAGSCFSGVRRLVVDGSALKVN